LVHIIAELLRCSYLAQEFEREAKISRIMAIVPACGGSRGLPNINILDLNWKSLLELSIDFAKSLDTDDIICSNDTQIYSDIAASASATVSGLRSKNASNSTAIEKDIIDYLNKRFKSYNYKVSEIVVWLRSTFIFRSLSKTNGCINEV